jgi:anaerobic selenocysteine-containing dehydrogenase
LDLGARLKLPGMVDDAGKPLYPGGYPDYIVNHERAPGVGPLFGWRGEDGESHGVGRPNPKQLERYIENGCFWSHHLPDDQKYFKHANKAYLEWASSVGFIPEPKPIIHQLYSEPLQKFRLAARGHGDTQPPEQHRGRIEAYFDPLPVWYAPFEHDMVDAGTYPLTAITQRPMHMYHSWGSQNAWLRQITNANRLYMSRRRAEALGVSDGDWVRVTSHHGSITVQAGVMDGCNDDTVWTWNAIGKRSGTWGLSKDAPESQKGFLLNHVISELLPRRADGYRYANADPVTGQAAWYDLRVGIERLCAAEDGRPDPTFDALPRRGVGGQTAVLRYGESFRKGRGS